MNGIEIEVAGFPITAQVYLRQSFTHRDVAFQVTNHGREKWRYSDVYEPSNGTYCYYILLSENMMSPELFEEFWLTGRKDEKFGSHVYYDYYAARWADAPWHCGVTWYSKEGGFDGEPRCVKIGCDYAHSWDDNMYYDLECVKRDAITTVDALCDMYGIYRRDSWNGKWMPEAQMVNHEGQLYTPEGHTARMAYLSESKSEKTI